MAKTALLWGVLGLAGLVGLGAAGWTAWNSTSAAHRAQSGDLMAIALVAPREPDLTPGPAALSVGALNDGYVHEPQRLAVASEDTSGAYSETAWLDTAWADPASLDHDWPMNPSPPPPSSAPALAPDDYRFGFDAQGPDYAAERAERRARLETTAPPSAPRDPVADTVFY